MQFEWLAFFCDWNYHILGIYNCYMPGSGETLLWGIFNSPRKPPETTPIHTELVFIDQSSQSQPYVQHGELDRFWDFSGQSGFGMIPESDEGFYHNEDRHRFVGTTLAKLFAFPDRGSELLEVGYGTNHFVAEGIVQQTNVPVCLLDFNNGTDEVVTTNDQHKPPQKIEPISEMLPRYVGDMTDIDVPGSALKDRKFAGIFYNGSWVAGGNNWTVMQIMEGKYAQALGSQPDWNSPQYIEHKDRQLQNILQTSKDHLTPNGVLFIGSSRYAYHGAGYGYDNLPDEKVEFLDVIRRLRQMGAKKISVIGVSNTELLKMFERNVENAEFQQLRTRRVFEKLFISDLFGRASKYRLSDENNIPIPKADLRQMISTPEQLNRVLDRSNGIKQMVENELAQQQAHGQLLLNQLMGGLESLPPSFQFSTVTPEMISRIKHDLKGFISPRIGRIDAVAAQF